MTFLKKAPSQEAVELLEGLSNDFDTLVVHGSEVHWRMRGRSMAPTSARAIGRRPLAP